MTTSVLARGLSAQLRRVNESPERLRERIADLERQIARRDAIIADLRAQLANTGTVGAHSHAPIGEGLKTITHAGRPAVTAATIARLHGVNISSVYRRLQSGKLQGAFVSGHWIVYTDQEISFKPYRRRSK